MSKVELADRQSGDVTDGKSPSGDESEAEASADEGLTPEVITPTAACRSSPPALLGIDTSAMLAMSEAVKNLQVSLVPAVRVPIPDVSRFVMSLPALEALRRPLVDPNILKIGGGESPVEARAAQITAGLVPLIQAQHDQIAKILRASESFFEDLFPENWHGVDGLRIEVVEKIVLDEGIPLVAVPRASTVQMLVSAPDLKARRAIIRRRWQSITGDCESCLRDLPRQDFSGFALYAGKVAAALRDGHTEAAQALGANLLDSLLRAHFDDDLETIKAAHKKRRPLALDDDTVRVAFAIAPAWAAYQTFRPSNGDMVPRDFARHASTHAVTARQYSRTNAVIVLMIVTSLLWLLEGEARG